MDRLCRASSIAAPRLQKPIRWVIMPTSFSVGAYRVVVYVNDHAPAHVHVVGASGAARFLLGSNASEMALVEVYGIPKRSLRRIHLQILARHDACRDAWDTHHGK